jgi:hypothetical protein
LSVLKDILATFNVVGRNQNRSPRPELLGRPKAQATPADIGQFNDEACGFRPDACPCTPAEDPEMATPIDGMYRSSWLGRLILVLGGNKVLWFVARVIGSDTQTVTARLVGFNLLQTGSTFVVLFGHRFFLHRTDWYTYTGEGGNFFSLVAITKVIRFLKREMRVQRSSQASPSISMLAHITPLSDSQPRPPSFFGQSLTMCGGAPNMKAIQRARISRIRSGDNDGCVPKVQERD